MIVRAVALTYLRLHEGEFAPGTVFRVGWAHDTKGTPLSRIRGYHPENRALELVAQGSIMVLSKEEPNEDSDWDEKLELINTQRKEKINVRPILQFPDIACDSDPDEKQDNS